MGIRAHASVKNVSMSFTSSSGQVLPSFMIDAASSECWECKYICSFCLLSAKLRLCGVFVGFHFQKVTKIIGWPSIKHFGWSIRTPFTCYQDLKKARNGMGGLMDILKQLFKTSELQLRLYLTLFFPSSFNRYSFSLLDRRRVLYLFFF